MAGITLEKAKTVYKYGQPMTALHLITKGSVRVTYPGGEYELGKGDVIGICEVCSEIHFLNYVTLEEITILTYPLTSIESLNDLLQKHSDVARLFLMSAFRQINTLLESWSLSELNCSTFYHDLINDYEKYVILCNRYHIQPRSLSALDEFGAYLGEELPDLWLNSYYLGLSHIYASENFKAILKESAVSLGLIRKCSLDFRKTYVCLEEQYHYLQRLSCFYFDESGNDLFDFYTSLYYKLGQSCEDISEIFSDINRMISKAESLPLSNRELSSQRISSFQKQVARLDTKSDETEGSDSDSNIAAELAGSLNTILDFAGSDLEIAPSFRQHVHMFKSLSDKAAMDDESCALRKAITEEFYVLYSILFERTLDAPYIPMPVRMFLYFGYADEELAGADNAALLYKLADNMEDNSEFGVYTFYDWLKAIFNGRKLPSRNEFELDYSDYIHKQKLSGYISDVELKNLERNSMSKVNYELRNMFPIVNKVTFGRITTFCPLFCADNVLKDLEDTLVTVSRLKKAIELIKKVDYSAFYRETLDTEHFEILGKETIHVEYMPDIILMPNVGIRGVMWQEIEGKYRNSSGRMLFSIFHLEDLTTSFIRMTGEFRWELCKRIQGNRWNDVSDRSLTSEYFDYIQFYKKNHDLSSEAKERIRTSLQRSKNSFKEMFVRDYTIWILFEGNGSPRLNKVARQILFTYCPFPADICESLSQNPLYTDLLNQHRLHTAQRLHHLELVVQKLKNSKSPIPDTIRHEITFAEGKPLT